MVYNDLQSHIHFLSKMSYLRPPELHVHILTGCTKEFGIKSQNGWRQLSPYRVWTLMLCVTVSSFLYNSTKKLKKLHHFSYINYSSK